MKKTTVGLIGTLLVLMLSSNAWAHSGLQINLGGFGLSISDNHSGFSTHSYPVYQSYLYNYSGYIRSRPYLGWGGYKSPHHHNNHKHWSNHRSNHHNKGHRNRHYRSYKRDHHNQHKGNHQHQGHRGRNWRR